jgi:hypothetical protein
MKPNNFKSGDVKLMTLKGAKDIQTNTLDNQPEFQELIIPGMEEFIEKSNTKPKLTSCTTPHTRQGFKSLRHS